MNKKLLLLIREEFAKLLQTKTGWGRNEILSVFDQAVTNAVLSFLNDDDNSINLFNNQKVQNEHKKNLERFQ